MTPSGSLSDQIFSSDEKLSCKIVHMSKDGFTMKSKSKLKGSSLECALMRNAPFGGSVFIKLNYMYNAVRRS